MNVHITDWVKFQGKGMFSAFRRVGCNVEIQEMFKFEDDSKLVADFIDQTEKYKVFALPIGINRNIPGLINQSFSTKRRSFKGEANYYVLVVTIMRVSEWDKGRSEFDEFIPRNILH